MNSVLQKTKSKTLKNTTADRLHNSTGNQLGVIAHLELLIEERQIFFRFEQLTICTQQVWENNYMQVIIIRVKLQ
jgi:hypothetical protein